MIDPLDGVSLYLQSNLLLISPITHPRPLYFSGSLPVRLIQDIRAAFNLEIFKERTSSYDAFLYDRLLFFFFLSLRASNCFSRISSSLTFSSLN